MNGKLRILGCLQPPKREDVLVVSAQLLTGDVDAGMVIAESAGGRREWRVLSLGTIDAEAFGRGIRNFTISTIRGWGWPSEDAVLDVLPARVGVAGR